MNYNYHTHTHRCGHASGDEETYIQNAIKTGITHMGFSDHMPFEFPDGYQSYYRVPVNETGDYFKVLSALREKYRDKIDIKIGFEMEYYPSHFEKMLDFARKSGAEYLILGQHFLGEEHPDGYYCGSETNREEHMCEYASLVISAMETGVFTYVAHPDVINFTGDREVYERESRKICKASARLGIPLEVNFLGIRARRNYPDPDFWRIAREEGAPVTFGHDAHSINSAGVNPETLDVARKLVAKCALRYIGKPDITPI
ncbi:MAG: histidinol-phosphatase [Clostridia bacterium]|nr:histidinol-phosphatase [Clostridia bacterium]